MKIDWLEIKEFIKDAVKYILTIVIVFFILVYVVSLQQVVGPSMSPTLESEDVLLLNKFTYRFFDVKRNDIISFDYAETKYLIKRVIGLPGEKIEYRNNYIYINDEPYEEPSPSVKGEIENFSLKDLGYDIIPDNMYLVLGDNREDSLDSREFGLIKKTDIKGKAFLRVWPINKLKAIR